MCSLTLDFKSWFFCPPTNKGTAQIKGGSSWEKHRRETHRTSADGCSSPRCPCLPVSAGRGAQRWQSRGEQAAPARHRHQHRQPRQPTRLPTPRAQDEGPAAGWGDAGRHGVTQPPANLTRVLPPPVATSTPATPAEQTPAGTQGPGCGAGRSTPSSTSPLSFFFLFLFFPILAFVCSCQAASRFVFLPNLLSICRTLSHRPWTGASFYRLKSFLQAADQEKNDSACSNIIHSQNGLGWK